MKKILFASIALLICCLQTEAQKYLNVYQDGIVIKRVLASEVDSISLTEMYPYMINLWHENHIFQSYATEEVDSIKVTDEKGDPLSYIDIIGFNSELYSKNIGLLSKSTVLKNKSFIDNLPKKDGTILYYAVDSALYALDKADIKTQFSNINFVTFTDGLDQGSIMKNPNYSSSNSYLQAISKSIKDTDHKGLKVDAYSIGLLGKDVSDVDMFKRNLSSLASSEKNVFEVNNINELYTRLQEIANRIISINTRQTVSVKIPGIDDGTRIRFTFDGKDADNSMLYIEGTLNLKDYSLHNVIYHGIKARSSSIVQGTLDGIFITYTFRGMCKEDGEGVLPTNNIKEYYHLPSSTTWQINSEFKPTNNIQQIVSYSGTIIVLVLDCSSSLGDRDFRTMKDYAKTFIEMVANNAMPYTFETPQNVKAAVDSTDWAINVSWDPVRYADYYQVYRSKSNSYYSQYELIADSVVSTSWRDDTPLSGNSYYKICAVGLGLISEQSTYSNTVKISLDAPKNVKAALDDEEFAVNISWDAVKYAEHYQIYRSPGIKSSNYELIADSITSCFWKDVSPRGNNISYKVYAVSHGVTSSASYNTSVYCNLEAPKNLKAELAAKGDILVVNLKWDPSKHAECYQVYRGSYIIADSVRSNSYIDESPSSGSNYYKVRAIGHGMTSSYSNTSNEIKKSMPTPTNVTGELIMSGNSLAISVTWDAIMIAEKYQVYRSNSTNGTYSLIGDNITSNSWTDRSPLSGNNYYKVVAIGYGMTSSKSYASNAVNLSIEAPKNVKATLYDGALYVYITWDAVKYAEKYQVYRSNSSNGTYSLIGDNITSNSWTDKSPLSGNNYYKVVAIGYGMTSNKSSASAAVSCSLAAPKNVTGELVISGNSLAIRVAWDAVKYAEKYQVYRCNSSSGTYSLIGDNITSNSWTDKSPLSGNNYYKIVAIGYGLTSSKSNASAAVNLSMSTPKNVSGELVLSGNSLAISVTWDAVKIAEKYQLYRSNSSSGTYNLIADNITSNSWTDKSPLSGNNYYKVVAIGYGMTSSKSNASAAVSCSLAAPKNVSGELVLSGNSLAIRVAWDAVKYAEKYQVYRSNSSSGTYNLIADNITSNSWTDKSPLSGNNYYKVVAIGHGLTSSKSNASAAVSCSLAAPGNVSGELVLSGNNLVINVKWDAVKYAEKYNVYRSSSYSGKYTQIAENVNSTSWKDYSPLAGSNYYKIYAVGYGLTSQASKYSNNVNYAISAPSNVSAELILSNNNLVASISWNAVTFAEYYTVYRSSSRSGTYTKLVEGVSATTWRDENPLNGSNYYKVSAYGYGLTSQQSSPSNVVSK